MGLKPETSKGRDVLPAPQEICAWLLGAARISCRTCSVAAALVTIVAVMHVTLVAISSPKIELGFDRSSMHTDFEASQKASVQASDRLVRSDGTLIAVVNQYMSEADTEAEQAVFSRINTLLDTEEPWPSCSRKLAIGGRCLVCRVSGERVLGQHDGDKALCFDLLPPNCTVLSFGVNNDFSFEEAMEDLGCTVHAFDPTMGTAGFRHSAGIEFHNVGLGPQDVSSHLTPISSFGTIVKQLGLEKGVIDYLKLDIESSEWGTLRQQLDSSGDLLRVRQLAVEFHLLQWEPKLQEGQKGIQEDRARLITLTNAERFLGVLEDLKRAGFRLVYRKPYQVCQLHQGGCLRYLWETLYINTRLT